MNDKKKKFLEEYEKIATKYELIITGCGCCNSPFVANARDENLMWECQLMDLEDNIRHLKKMA